MTNTDQKLIPATVAIVAMALMAAMMAAGCPDDWTAAVLHGANGALSMWLLLLFTGRLK